jgi:hypothetical protein
MRMEANHGAQQQREEMHRSIELTKPEKQKPSSIPVVRQKSENKKRDRILSGMLNPIFYFQSFI